MKRIALVFFSCVIVSLYAKAQSAKGNDGIKVILSDDFADPLVLKDGDLSFAYSQEGKSWTGYSNSMNTQGFQHNIMGKYYSLKPAFFWKGKARFRLMTLGLRSWSKRSQRLRLILIFE